MDTDPRLSLTIVIILIFLASYFAKTETALASVSKSKLKTASDRGDGRADDALYCIEFFDRAITTLLICTNIVHIAAASIVTVTVTGLFGISWVSLSTIVTTIIVFFFGEMLPKSIAKKIPENIILKNASVLTKLMKVFYPLSTLLAKIGELASKLSKSETEVSVTEEELFDIIDDLEEEGTLEEDESDLIQSAIEFGDQKVNNIFTKRGNIEAVEVHEKAEDVLKLIKSNTHSRLPVYEDHFDNIIGILSIRDYIKAYLNIGDKVDIRKLMSTPLIITKNYNIDEILELMSDRKYTLAIVKDKNGRVTGLISMEDILEELVGEIYDEDESLGGIK